MLLKIGDQFVKAGATDDAIATYREVARLFQEQRAMLKALAVYKQVLKLDPRHADAPLRIEELRRELGITDG